jgi:outer membrane protein assembly factor BamD
MRQAISTGGVAAMVDSWRMLIIVLVAVFAVCCSSPNVPKTERKSSDGTDERIFVADTIEKKRDPHVILKRGESFFEKEDYPEAIIEYQHFLDLHSTHTLASYAQYQLAESYFKQIKSVERDPHPIYKALETFEKLRRGYPGSRYDGNAVERIAACHRFIAEVHLMVGQFYYRRDALLAAAHRFERILTLYPEMDIAEDALYYLALTYKGMGANDWARETLIALSERFPDSQHAASGQVMITNLNLDQSRATDGSIQASNRDENQTKTVGSLDDPLPAAISLSSLAPVSSLQNTPNGSASTESILCRLGVQC